MFRLCAEAGRVVFRIDRRHGHHHRQRTEHRSKGPTGIVSRTSVDGVIITVRLGNAIPDRFANPAGFRD